MYSGNSSNSSASTSTANGNSLLSGEYEVFLSFCGKDTRNGFTDFLYTYLQDAGVRTFRDDNELRVGEEIGPELMKAIKSSKISIPIFSKNYASSKWCLLELTCMVECEAQTPREKMIFPIFYDVNPDDVRHQSGSYEEAFRQHEKKKRLDEKMVQSWKATLTKVGKLKGLELNKETGGREGELVKITVKNVLQFLKKNYSHLPKNLVEMDNHIEKLKGLLEVDSNEVRIVGIHGMCGLGKTTIAKIIYNQLCEQFEGHCFLDNIRGNSRPRDRIVNLQNQLISKIQNRKVSKFNNFYEGRDRIKEAVRGRKVLIVLDDVDENFQVNMLMGDESLFGVRSRIIITTRNRGILDSIKIACQSKDLLYAYTSYQPDLMDDYHSLQLFCKYAFRRDYPMDGYEHLSSEVVSIAAGLPLVLVILGSTFFVVKGKDLWKEKLRKLKEIPHAEVQEKLRFSFEALEYDQKQIFLDIACLFIGSDVTITSYMWDDCKFYPQDGLSVLVNRSLITVGDDNELIMHDTLRDLGRQIVREEGLQGKQSRFWCEEEAVHILKTREGSNSVNALCLPFEPYEGPLLASSFNDLPNLRYLKMNGQDLHGVFKYVLSNLRWLRWRCLGKFTPTNLDVKNLVILDLSYSHFTKDWEGWSQLKMGKKLKVLDLSQCYGLRLFPHLSIHTNLEILKLKDCKSLCRLDGLEQLKSLKYLDASGCYNLETLPSLSNLINLIELYLGGCEKLVEIQGLEKLESLQVLDISYCRFLKRLPNCSKLKNLKRFVAERCRNLLEIEGLNKLNFLEYLDLRSCGSLKGVLDMSYLNKLEIFYGSSCEKLQGLDRLESLKLFDVDRCEKLVEIQGLDRLKSLKIFVIRECPSLERFPDLPNFGMLKDIMVDICNKLDEVEGLGLIESLERVVISRCYKLRKIPDLRSLKNLKTLSIFCLEELTRIHGLEQLESLEQLNIRECKSIEALPNFSKLEKLTKLDVSGCVKLTEIRGLEELKSLEWLVTKGCKSIETLPDFSKLEKLTELDISGCVKLTEILGLEELKSLKDLLVVGCEGLRNLPDLPNTMIHRNLDEYSTSESSESVDDFGSESIDD